MDGEPNLGAKSVCGMCGAAIVFMGPHWDHMGESKPRHPATPKQDAPPPQWLGAWIEELEPREQVQVRHAVDYAQHYSAAGIPGHNHIMLIAKLARLLGTAQIGMYPDPIGDRGDGG